MGLETSKQMTTNYGNLFQWFNVFVITIFTIEVSLRVYIHKSAFFKDAWSLFDFFIVTISLIPTSAGFEILRVLRVLRLLRLVSVVPQMRKITTALVSVIPGIASIGGLLTLFFYIFAIMSTELFGEKFPEWFGTLGESFYTLFQIMTLESWSMGIVRPVMDTHPLAWLFFVPFIFLTTFIIVNLIIATVVDAMNEMKEAEKAQIIGELHTSDDTTKQELQKIRNELKELKVLIKNNASVHKTKQPSHRYRPVKNRKVVKDLEV